MIDLKKRKAKRIAILSFMGVLVFAALCFVFGFAIADGWGAVFAWFTSKWATLVVVVFFLALIGFGGLYFSLRDKEDFK